MKSLILLMLLKIFLFFNPKARLPKIFIYESEWN